MACITEDIKQNNCSVSDTKNMTHRVFKNTHLKYSDNWAKVAIFGVLCSGGSGFEFGL